MYAEEILDHYRNPRNFGKMEKPDAAHRELNPICGDEYEFQIKVSGGKIEDVKFSGDGCAISTASASKLSELVKGKKVSEVEEMSSDEVVEMLGIPVSPARMKCALLPLSIVKKCAAQMSKMT